MPPKNKIKIVDVDDKEIKNDDEYAITVDEVKEGELPTENEPSETTEETTTIIQEKMKMRERKLAKIQQLLNQQKKKENSN